MFSDFLKRALVVCVATVGLVMVTTSIMAFAGISPTMYNPYMYFIIALAVLGLFLSPKPTNVLFSEESVAIVVPKPVSVPTPVSIKTSAPVV
jgi:hypothetical protein